MRNGDILGEFISEDCIARLAEPDAADLLVPQPVAVNMSVLTTQRKAVAERESATNTIDHPEQITV